MRQALHRAASSATLTGFISQYELSNYADGKSPKTIGWYSDILKSYLRYRKENVYPDNLSNFNIDSVREYILYLRRKPKFAGHPFTPEQGETVSAQTIRGHVRALKAFSTWLYRSGHTRQNRLQFLKLPKAPVRLMEVLTPEEIEKIISTIDKHSPTGIRNHAIFVTALDTGLRAAEMASITVGQLNMKGGFIKVIGKGNKERIVPIGEFVRMTLWHYVTHVRPDHSDSHCDSLFLSRHGQAITPNTIKLVFTRLAKSSGVERLHAHLCRHTFAVNYLLNGGDIFSLREILGHTSLEMVNHYVHFTTAQITGQHHKYSPMDRLKRRNKQDITSTHPGEEQTRGQAYNL
jgi:site-specific recombinase XerD